VREETATLILPGIRKSFLRLVCETGKTVILISRSEDPMTLHMLQNIQAQYWFTGCRPEGGPATADVLFGGLILPEDYQ